MTLWNYAMYKKKWHFLMEVDAIITQTVEGMKNIDCQKHTDQASPRVYKEQTTL